MMFLYSCALRRSINTIRPQLVSRSIINKAICFDNSRLFSTTKMTPFLTPSSDRPKHEMQYFPDMLTALPSESAEFRRVLWTGLYSQVVLMTVPVGGDIGDEIHTVDQILTFTSGTGLAQVGGKEQKVKAGDLVIVPAGTQHQFINTGSTPLLLYTVYSPAEHKTTTVHKTKEQGDKEEEKGRDEPPEWSQKSKAENEKEGWVKVT
ncbi:RmlC-like cupin domain-containing protein [Xylaria cubensis]|nr:RmlC-like cupin domain-containing protein [Xylaria cubensis]